MTERVRSAAKPSEPGNGVSPVFPVLKKITPEFGPEWAGQPRPSREDASFALRMIQAAETERFFLSLGWYRGPSVPLGWRGFFNTKFCDLLSRKMEA